MKERKVFILSERNGTCNQLERRRFNFFIKKLSQYGWIECSFKNMDEFAVLKTCLPLKENLSKYLQVKTTINYAEDLEFRMAVTLENTVRKFSHSGWTEMKPMVIGIKCYTKTTGFVYVRHEDKQTKAVPSPKSRKAIILDAFEVQNEEWHTFKYPLLDNYHTETRIILSDDITVFTLAILDTSTCVRDLHHTNEFPSGYASFDTTLYGQFNKAVVYEDEKGPLLSTLFSPSYRVSPL